MPSDRTYPGYKGQPRLLTVANGAPLTTTRSHIAIPAGAKHVTIIPRNLSATTVLAKVALNPWLTILHTSNAMATDPTNASEAAQDGAAATVVDLSSLPTLVNGGAVYIGADDLIGGLTVDVLAGDGGAGVMTVHFWNGSAWTDISATDNTSGFGSDGTIVWTVPTTWVRAPLADILALPYPKKGTGQDLFWIRITTSVAYDASTTASSIYAINRAADVLMELPTGVLFESEIDRPQNGGNIQALTDAGTANLIVTGYF